ncbi:hypothetical protein [Pseudomonas protegens]|uniref:hypothetical protein n=1 Tax=Pseudomonas protegens TaxID=380021 RepID=UPI002160E57B|nr:hypothetical protein [Pseudomonas protegens]UVM13811.1 hypothetical protein LOY29_14375 [Pseudomonas protegens]
MFKLLVLAFFLVLAGCTTNQLHFAPYSTEAELSAIQKQKTDVDVTKVSGADNCVNCTERSSIVWHAANYNGSLYQGFSAIPVSDWEGFVRSSVLSDSHAPLKAEIVVNRIFLKTWNNPEYYACQSEITVYIGQSKLDGRAVVKIPSSGQWLVEKDLALLNPEVLKAIQLSLKAAYLNAIQKR